MQKKVSNSKDRLKELLEYYNVNISEFARRVQIPRSTISYYLSGSRDIGQLNLTIISERLGINIDWLVGMDAPMFDTTIKDDLLNQKQEIGELFYAVSGNDKILHIVKQMTFMSEHDLNLFSEIADRFSK